MENINIYENIGKRTGGDIYISVMTIVSSIRQMVETPIYAINEGSSPIISYNYGAKEYKRVKKIYNILVVIVVVSVNSVENLVLSHFSRDF